MACKLHDIDCQYQLLTIELKTKGLEKIIVPLQARSSRIIPTFINVMKKKV